MQIKGQINVLFLLPYPQSTFEALLVKTINWGDYLEELVDALLVVEVGELLEGLLDLLPQCLCLETVMKEREGKGGNDFGRGRGLF